VLSLIPLRTQTGKEPVIIAPHGVTNWQTCERLRPCEVYALPDDDAVFSVWFWLQLTDRDVTFWPIDVRSSHVMTLIVQELLQRRRIFTALRWAWGHPAARELGEPEAKIDTLYRRDQALTLRAAE
jgi:hypothetical protein